MRQRARMFFTFLAAGLIILGAFIVMAPAGASAASQAKLTSQVSTHSPHIFYKKGSSHYHNNVVPAAANNLNYGGGPVMTGTANVYAIFWEPGGNVAANYNSLIQRYFGDVGGSPLYQIANQYTQTGGGFPSGAHLVASWTDSSAYPRSPLLDTDIQNEVTRAQQANAWSSGIDNIFFVFTGRSQDLCTDSTHTQCASNAFCAYHNIYGSNNTIYAAMPYAASFSCNPGSSPNSNDADQTINVTSHEQMEAATDPYLNAWTDTSGSEIGDKCAWIFGTLNSQGADVVYNNNPYILQEEWDNNTGTCRLTPSTNPTPTPTPTNTPTPTPTGTPTPPPTPTPTPPPGGNLITNGGFESGTTGWTQSSSGGYQIVDPTRPHTGLYSAYLCGYNNCRDTIYQTVSIPSTSTSATLTYYWYMDTTETYHSYDYMYVRVRNTAGSTLTTLQTISDGSSANGWHSASFSVLGYKGQTVQIAFVGTNDISNPTDFFVDDVALNTN